MNYLIPFASLRHSVRFVSEKGNLKADMTYEEFLDIVRKLLAAVPVDEEWYRAQYPDVAAAIDAGAYANATSHFIDHGYIEGRRPYQVKVDEAFYLSTYADVREGIAEGTIASAQEHYDRHGHEEGRLPVPPL